MERKKRRKGEGEERERGEEDVLYPLLEKSEDYRQGE